MTKDETIDQLRESSNHGTCLRLVESAHEEAVVVAHPDAEGWTAECVARIKCLIDGQVETIVSIDQSRNADGRISARATQSEWDAAVSSFGEMLEEDTFKALSAPTGKQDGG